jgi:tetratricopeptide (TPR) repeat protein
MHWDANKKSFPAAPELSSSVLGEGRRLHQKGAYEDCIEFVQSQEDWESDPRAWRLLGLCWHGLAQYQAEPVQQRKLYELAECAHQKDRALRLAECAKADVNLAGVYLTQQRYEDAMRYAVQARETDPRLATAHIAILAIHLRRNDQAEVKRYIAHLNQYESWIFEDPIFEERLRNDPDLFGLRELTAEVRS